MENIFKGLGIALVTPFCSDGSVDYPKLGQLVEYQMSRGIDFLCVLGSTAETPCLSDEEKVSIKNFVVEVVKGRIPILLGFGHNCTHLLLEEIRHFDFKGVDGILSVCPYYNKPSQEGIYQHFEAIAKAANMPLIIYNVPGRTGTNIKAETTLRLARNFSNIVAIKEASGKIDQIDDIIKNKPEHFDVISGDDSITYELISLGATGVISVVGNALPDHFGAMVHPAIKGKYDQALPAHHQLADIYRLLSIDGNPSGIKALLSGMGLIDEYLRLPLVAARKETKDKLMEAFHSLR